MPREYYGPWSLTPRQAQIFDAILVHGSNADVAAALGMKLKTVEVHLQQAYDRMRTAGAALGRGNVRTLALTLWMRWRQEKPMDGRRMIADIGLAVAPGEPDDPQRAKAFDLTWWEKFGQPEEAERKQGEWHFCRKRLEGDLGRALLQCERPDHPMILAVVAGTLRYNFTMGRREAVSA